MCEKGGELIRPNYTLEKFAVFEENINGLVLIPRVCVCSKFASVFPWVGVYTV